MNRANLSNLAVVWREVGKVTVESVPVPEPAPHEVVVKVRTSGLCGTDLHIAASLVRCSGACQLLVAERSEARRNYATQIGFESLPPESRMVRLMSCWSARELLPPCT
jgi:threonine dehydrogenase-like Zn-dependent dehydrogenase